MVAEKVNSNLTFKNEIFALITEKCRNSSDSGPGGTRVSISPSGFYLIALSESLSTTSSLLVSFLTGLSVHDIPLRLEAYNI